MEITVSCFKFLQYSFESHKKQIMIEFVENLATQWQLSRKSQWKIQRINASSLFYTLLFSAQNWSNSVNFPSKSRNHNKRRIFPTQ